MQKIIKNPHHSRKTNGLIEQWGYQAYSTTISGGDNKVGSFITFGAMFTVLPSITVSHHNNNQINMVVDAPTKEGFYPKYRNVNTNNSALTTGSFWIAMGF